MKKYKNKYEIMESIGRDDYFFLKRLYSLCLYNKKSFRDPIKLRNLYCSAQEQQNVYESVIRLVKKGFIVLIPIVENYHFSDYVVLKPVGDIITK